MQKTFTVVAATGQVLALGETVTQIDISNRVDVWVKPVYSPTSTPDAPSVSPAVAAATAGGTDYVHLVAAGEGLELDGGKGIPVGSTNKGRWTHVLIYPIASGDVTISGV